MEALGRLYKFLMGNKIMHNYRRAENFVPSPKTAEILSITK